MTTIQSFLKLAAGFCLVLGLSAPWREASAQDSFEVDNSLAAAKLLPMSGDVQERNFHAPSGGQSSDIDWIRVEVPPGTKYINFKPKNQSFSNSWRVSLKNSQGGNVVNSQGLHVEPMVFGTAAVGTVAFQIDNPGQANVVYYCGVAKSSSGSFIGNHTTYQSWVSDTPPVNNTGPHEPNNTDAQATLLSAGAQQTHVLDIAGDHDWIRYPLTQNTTSTLTVEPATPQDWARWRLDVYRKTPGVSVLEHLADKSTTMGTGTVTISGLDATHVLGTDYYLQVKAIDSQGFFGSDTTYSVRYTSSALTNNGPFEPNNSAETANNISAGASQSHFLDIGGDVDWIKYVLPSNYTSSLTVTPVPGSSNTPFVLDVYRQLGSAQPVRLPEKSTTMATSAVLIDGLNADPTQTTTYYLRVSTNLGNFAGNQTNYQVALATSVLPPFEPNDSAETATAINAGASQTHYLDVEGDQDWVRYSLPVNTISTIVVEPHVFNTSNPWKLDVYKQLPNGQPVLMPEKSLFMGGSTVRIEGLDAVHSEGTSYYLHVRARDGVSLSGNASRYRVSLSTGLLGGPNEPNQIWQTLTPISAGVTAHHRLDIAGDVDWNGFWLEAGTSGGFMVTPTAAGLPLVPSWNLHIYEQQPGQDPVWRSDLSTTMSSRAVAITGLSAPAASGRGYYLVVSAVSPSFHGANTAYSVALATNVPMAVALTAPANGATFSAPATVNLAATATGGAGGISGVQFYRGSTLVCTVPNTPYVCTDNNVPTGNHSYTARAFDFAPTQNQLTSAAVNVTVTPPVSLSVSLTAPANGASFTAPANINLAATASGGVNGIDRVEFYRGSTLIHTDNSDPYSHIDANLPPGTYNYSAKVFDNGTPQNQATSSTATVTVSPPTSLTVALTAPVNGASFTAPANINLAATASGGVNGIDRVEFYRGSALIHTDNNSPYTHLDANVAPGTYSYSAKAFDNGTPQNQATSSTATVTVQNPTSSGESLPPALAPASKQPPSQSEILASSLVGTLDGSIRVSESGAPSFSIQFDTAPGRGGVVPEIGLAYSGEATLGHAGIGFNITGLSAISRCRKTSEAGDGPGPHAQINFDSNDANDVYCLDGQRLLAWGQGTQVIDGVSYSYTEYRTEIESFQRIRAFADVSVYGPLFWRVEGKDGSIREFGRNYFDLQTNAGVYANDGQIPLRFQIRRLQTGGRYHLLSWAISAQLDRLGNRIRYRYETNYQGIEPDPYLQHYLTHVFYTGFTGVPTGHEHAALVFEYRNDDDPKTLRGWVAGSYSEKEHRLVTVKSCLRNNPTLPLSASDIEGTTLCDSTANTLRVYDLGYEKQVDLPETASTNPNLWVAGRYGSKRHRLTTLRACADVAKSICWPATTISWSAARAGFDPFNSQMQGGQFDRASAIRFADVTGDGRPDAVWRQRLTANEPDKIWFTPSIANSANGAQFGAAVQIAFVPDALDNNQYGNDPDRNWGLLDVNGDGFDDLVNTELVSSNGPWAHYVRYATGNSNGFELQREPLAGTFQFFGPAILAQFQFTDLDGDGIVDMLSPKPNGSSAILQVAKGVRQSDGRLAFLAPVDVVLDFNGVPTSCYRIGFGRKHRADRWDSYDFNGDSLADLALRVQNTCSTSEKSLAKGSIEPGANYVFGLNPEVAPAPNAASQNGPSNPAAALVEWGVFVAQDLSAFKLIIMPSGVADAEGALRPADINGDGLLDLIFQEGNDGTWHYQMNRGDNTFTPRTCLLQNQMYDSNSAYQAEFCFATDLPNSQSIFSTDGQLQFIDYDGDGYLDVWHAEDDPINQQSSSGKRFRVYRWRGDQNPGAPNTSCAGVFQCSDFERRRFKIFGLFGQDLLSIPSGVWTNAISGGTTAWGHMFVDLDNDGFGDSLTYKRDGNSGNLGYILVRSVDNHQPRDVITGITSGFGASTTFDYSPLSYTSIYTRDFDAPKINGWGRGGTVVDLAAPSFVVTTLSTPAPTVSNPNGVARMHYRYQGMKAQTGGRGNLGFRKIYSLNAQNNVETATEYEQQYPLSGRPRLTESRALNSAGLAHWRLVCQPDAPATDPNACFYGQPQCASGACPHFSGNDPDATLRGQTLARNIDVNAWRSRAPGTLSFGAENAALQAGVPAQVFAYTKETVSEKYELNAQINQVISSSRTRFFSDANTWGYDHYGNLLSSRVESFLGTPNANPEQTVLSSNSYESPDLTSWQIGKLSTTSVTHSRPNETPVTRSTAFAYTSFGQLRMERVQPGSTQFQFTKYTEYDTYGMPAVVYSCSKPVEDAGRCSNNFNLGNTVAAGADARQWVYRFGRTDFDPQTSLPTTTYVLRSNGASLNLVVAATTVYNKWGLPERVTPTDGAIGENTYDHFGRVVHQYSATGAQSTTLLARCDGSSVRCPANAVTRAHAFSLGGSQAWSYADRLARNVATLSELYKRGEYSVVYSDYDGLGRKIRQTEPVSTTQGPNNAHALPSSSGLVSTESCYDVGGRVTYVKLPNHTGSFDCNTPPTAAQLLNTTPDGNNISATFYRGVEVETVNGLGQAQKTISNSMGETVKSVDSNGSETVFQYDAAGKLKSVTRGQGTADPSTMSYDVMGRRTVIQDPSTGIRRSFFNPAGESIREIDAKGQCAESTYDFNGRVVSGAEFAAASGDVCSGTASKLITHTYDRDRLGTLSSSAYGNSANPNEAGSVRMDVLYDAFSRPVSTRRCIVALTVSRGDALNCRVEQQGYDQFGRAYWSTDASSEGNLHDSNPYLAAGAQHRGVRMHYSDANTSIGGVPLHSGFAFKTTSLDGSRAVYEVLQTNARGQVTQERVDGKAQFTTSRGYEASTGRLLSLNTGSLQNLSVGYDEIGNLRYRWDNSGEGANARVLREFFDEYDLVNRVKRAELFNGVASQGVLTMDYSVDGNLNNKVGTGSYLHSHIGGYQYGNSVNVANCAAGSSHAVRAISDTVYCYDANGNNISSLRRSDFAPQRMIAYTLFNKPSQIDSLEIGGPGHSTRYGYGPGREMAYRIDIPQYAGSIANASVEVQYFGSVERELRKTAVAGQTRETYKRMIHGVLQVVEERVVNDGTAAIVSPSATLRSEVMLKDHLGSTHVIIHSDGTNPQYQRFDVWGLRADANTGSTQTLAQSYQNQNPNDPNKTRTRKGYTGHEMVDGAGIVHMQGRIYDPRLGRFLQADPIIQDPLNGQNYNRYTYVYNNPLSMTDPSGYRSLRANLELYWKPIVAIAIVVYTGGQVGIALEAGKIGPALAWASGGGAAAGAVTTGTLRGTVTGAVDGALTFGIGQALKGHTYALIIAHAMKGGLLQSFNGGDFGQGAISAGLSKIVGMGVDDAGMHPAMEIIVQALAGGTISEATGGKFVNGALSAAIQFAFNQALSKLVLPYTVEAGERGEPGTWGDVGTAYLKYQANTLKEFGPALPMGFAQLASLIPTQEFSNQEIGTAAVFEVASFAGGLASVVKSAALRFAGRSAGDTLLLGRGTPSDLKPYADKIGARVIDTTLRGKGLFRHIYGEMRKAESLVQIMDGIPDQLIAGKGQWSRMEKLLIDNVKRLSDKTYRAKKSEFGLD